MAPVTRPVDEWSPVAQAWDRNAEYVDGHSAAATDALAASVRIRPGDRVLELAAGPGALGARWSQLAGPSGHVVISDGADGMVDVARRRNAGLDNVEVAVLDASSLDCADASFDVVVCRMGLMFTPEPAAAFAEIRRVLAPGGRFGALTWGGIEHNPWMTCVGMAAMMNGVVGGGPPVGPGGIFSLGDPALLGDLARNTGFTDVLVDQFEATFRADSIDAHVERVSSLAGPLASAFADATPAQLTAVCQTAAQLAAGYITDDGVALPARMLLVAGHVPDPSSRPG